MSFNVMVSKKASELRVRKRENPGEESRPKNEFLLEKSECKVYFQGRVSLAVEGWARHHLSHVAKSCGSEARIEEVPSR